MQPNIDLMDILRYKRAHGSKTEAAYINNYLIPAINGMGYRPYMDMAGNIWVEIVESRVAPYLFVSHIDTRHRGEGFTDPKETDGIISVNPDDIDGCCLGADDGVGMYVSLKMLQAGVAGTYLFTRGEEVGGIGAGWIADNMADKLAEYKLAVEVDRRGTDEIIFVQGFSKCASEDFAEKLGDAIGMGHEPSDGGVFTDVALFVDKIPECVNISAGYEYEHTVKEYVDATYVEKLVSKMIAVEWYKLPIKRSCADQTYDYSGYEYSGQNYTDYDYGEIEKSELYKYVFENPDVVTLYLEEVGVDIPEMEYALKCAAQESRYADEVPF